MITYFIKSGLCLALLLAFYHLVLEREKMHRFNRFYLLGSVLFSFLAPLYIIYEYIPVVAETFAPTMIFEEGFVTEEVVVEKPFNYTPYLIGLYTLVSLVLLIRFSKNLFSIILKIRKSRHLQLENATIVLVEDAISPHTFWNYIFINKDEYFSEKIENELFTHELTHVTQKHTLDILLIEFLQVLFWINPTFILLKKAIKLNHEFLADNKVISTHKNTTEYQYLLLNRATWNNEYYLASNLNYLLTKKRLQMMTKQSSRSLILLKKLAVLPLLAGFIFLFAERVTAQEKADPKIVAEYNKLAKKYNNQTDDKRFIKMKEVQRMNFLYGKLNDNQKLNAEQFPNIPPPPPRPPHPQDTKKDVYKNFHYKDGHFMFTDKNGKKVKKKYHELTDEQKKLIPPPPPIELKKRRMPDELFQQLKDESKYAIWIDGKSVKNSILNQYKSTDFANYIGSKVHKNARSERFPQLHQYYLMTYPYFEKKINKKKRAFKMYKQSSKQSIETNFQQIPDFNSDGKFLISVEKDNNFLRLRCYDCRWANLKLDLNKKFIINDFGFSNGKTLNRDFFAFEVKATQNNVVLNSLKGTAWKDLSVDLTSKKRQYINQDGKVQQGKKKFNNLGRKNSKQSFYQKNRIKIIEDVTETVGLQDENTEQVGVQSLVNNQSKIKESVGNQDIQETKPKAGWIIINNLTHYYVKYPNGKTDYYDRWGNQVDKNGKIISPTKQLLKKRSDGIETGFITINEQTIYFVKNKEKITFYNRWGQKVDKTGKIIDVKRTNSDEVILNENITKVYKGDEVVVEFKRNNLSEKKNIVKISSSPSPPKPISPLDFMKEQKDKNADYFYNGKKINYKKALDLLENKRPIQIKSQKVNGKMIIDLTKKVQKKTSLLDSIPSKTGWEQVGTNYYAYKVFNGKKYYFDKDSGKQVSVKHPESGDYDTTMQRIKYSKKEYYVENKKVSKEQFQKTKNGNTKYYYTGFYTKKNTVYKFHASKSKDFIEKLTGTSIKKGYSAFNNQIQIINPNTKVPNDKEFKYYLDKKLIAKKI